MSTLMMKPDQAVRFFKIALDELALNSDRKAVLISDKSVFIAFSQIAMPTVSIIDGQLSLDQVSDLREAIDRNYRSSRYRFAHLRTHWYLKSFKIRTRKLYNLDEEWWSRKENQDKSFYESPFGSAQARINRFISQASAKSMPGYEYFKNYSSYMDSLIRRAS